MVRQEAVEKLARRYHEMNPDRECEWDELPRDREGKTGYHYQAEKSIIGAEYAGYVLPVPDDQEKKIFNPKADGTDILELSKRNNRNFDQFP